MNSEAQDSEPDLETAQNGDGVLHTWLGNVHALEPSR